MSSWGREVSAALTGTVAVTQNSNNITGTSTVFLTQLKTGETIRIAGVEYIVDSITSNTAAVLSVPYAGTTASGLTCTKGQKPTADKTRPLSTIHGVDRTEVAMKPGVAGPGWVRVKTIGSRKVYETLVAMKTPPVENDTLDAAEFPNTTSTTTTTSSTTTTTTAAPTTTTTTP